MEMSLLGVDVPRSRTLCTLPRWGSLYCSHLLLEETSQMMADRGIGLLPWPLGSQGVRVPCAPSPCGFCTPVEGTTATVTISKSAVLNRVVKSISASPEHRVWRCVRQSSARNSMGSITLN